jgi:hypothetical protein
VTRLTLRVIDRVRPWAYQVSVQFQPLFDALISVTGSIERTAARTTALLSRCLAPVRALAGAISPITAAWSASLRPDGCKGSITSPDERALTITMAKSEMAEPAGTTMTLAKHRGRVYTLQGSTQPAFMTMSGWRSRADATVGTEDYEFCMVGLFSRSACAYSPGQRSPVLRIGRRNCFLPVPGEADWFVKRRLLGYEATLRADQIGEINLRLGRGTGKDILATVYGQWPARDLVVLTAAFALLIRRRDDNSASGGSAAVIATTAG